MPASFGARTHRRTGRAIAQWERDHERNGAGGGRTEAERRIIQTSPVDDAFRQRPLEGGLWPLRRRARQPLEWLITVKVVLQLDRSDRSRTPEGGNAA